VLLAALRDADRNPKFCVAAPCSALSRSAPAREQLDARVSRAGTNPEIEATVRPDAGKWARFAGALLGGSLILSDAAVVAIAVLLASLVPNGQRYVPLER
jgi:hypothetical protein